MIRPDGKEKGRDMSRPTMRDIGKAVGVSAVTVSKALAGKPGMSEIMRQRILKKAEELNYHYPEEERRQTEEKPAARIVSRARSKAKATRSGRWASEPNRGVRGASRG